MVRLKSRRLLLCAASRHGSRFYVQVSRSSSAPTQAIINAGASLLSTLRLDLLDATPAMFANGLAIRVPTPVRS